MNYFYSLILTLLLILPGQLSLASSGGGDDFSGNAGAGCVVDTSSSYDISIQNSAPCKVKPYVKELECNTDNTGAIGLEHISGTGPFTYEWSNGARTKDIKDLKPGTYRVKVIDATGASDSHTVTLKAPVQLQVTTEVKQISGEGMKDGSILIKGVRSGYSVKCFGPNGLRLTQQTELYNLAEGEYIIMVSDKQSCASVLKVKLGAKGSSNK